MDLDKFNEANLTADISDEDCAHEMEEQDPPDTPADQSSPVSSTATIVAESEEITPLQSRYRGAPYKRMSLSQPVLSSDGHKEFGQRAHSQLLAKGERFPFLEVKEENEKLKRRVYELQEELNEARYREREAVQQLSRPVQDVIEEFYSLQKGRTEAEISIKKFDDLQELFNKLQADSRKVEKHLEAEIRRVSDENEQLKSDIHQLKSDAFADDFTLASDTDGEPGANATMTNEVVIMRKQEAEYRQNIASLENEVEIYKQKLAAAEQVIHENTAQGKTFVLDSNQDLLAKIDELEVERARLIEDENKFKTIILNYMTKVSKLERQLQQASLSSAHFNTTNLDLGDRSKVLDFVEKLKDELLTTADKNRSLRRECNRFLGEDDADVTKDVAVEIGRKTSSEESAPVPSSPAPSVVDSICDDETGKLVNYVNDLMAALEDKGFSFADPDSFRQNESSVNEPGIDLNNRSSEMLQRFDNPLFAVEAIDHVSLLNSSMNMILQTSMNANADINIVKNKLSTLRDVLVSMFNRLKGSAALFEEILQFLANEGHNEVCDKIRNMQLIWASSADEAKEIEEAVDHAEQSIHGLQAHISVLEQSIVQTSFILDQTRRMTLANATELQFSRLSIRDTDLDYANALNDARLELQVQSERARSREEELNYQLSEAKNAKEVAENKLELVQKQLSVAEIDRSSLQMHYEQLSSELGVAKAASAKTSAELQMIEEKSLTLQEKISNLTKKLEDSQTELMDTKIKMDQQASDIATLTGVRNDLVAKVADAMLEKEEILTRLEGATERVATLEKTIQDKKIQISELNRSLTSAQQSLKDRCTELTSIEQQAMGRVRLLEDQLRASRENATALQEQIHEKQQELEILSKPNIQRLSRPDLSTLDLSLIQKSGMPNRETQTDLRSEDINRLEAKLKQMSEEQTELYALHNKLDRELRYLLFKRPSGDDITLTDLKGVQKNCECLVQLLQEEQKLQIKTKEEITRLQELIESSGKSDSSRSSQKTISFNKTPIDYQKHRVKLRQDAYTMTSMANDLTQNLKKAAAAKQRNIVFSMDSLVDDARELRTKLNDLLTLCDTRNKENLPAVNLEELTIEFNLINKRNEELFMSVRDIRRKYEDLKKKTQSPDLISRINAELNSIHNVMNKAQVVTGRSTGGQ